MVRFDWRKIVQNIQETLCCCFQQPTQPAQPPTQPPAIIAQVIRPVEKTDREKLEEDWEEITNP
jgi:hypothetical protein